ncbi:MAG: hypothetical protein MUE79_03080, partial [Nitratireductor sp.]|nr:hypothetical protein [Nitratireductor sp.]
MLATLPDCITSGDACVFPSGSLTPKRIVDGALIDCKLDSLRERASVTINVLMNRLSRSAAVPQIGLILRPNAKNYGHCLTEALPALYLLNAAGFDPPIVVPETATLPFMREVLACYSRLRFHFMSPGEAIRAKVGFYIAAPFSRSIEESILPNARFLADTLGVKPGDGPRRIHVTRSGRRRI